MTQVRLAEVFVEMADTLVDDFDVIDFLHGLTVRCVELLDVSAAGLMLSDERGRLRMIAASSEKSRLLELFQLQTDQGPCVDCFRTGCPVTEPDLRATDSWPHFTQAAAEAGFASVHALPMRLRDEVIGALNLFRPTAGQLDEEMRQIAQALADVATIGLLQQRAITRRDSVTEQLQSALFSRVLIEQAKGVIAERLRLDMDEAFTALRDHARSHNRRLSELAQAVLDGSEQITAEPDEVSPVTSPRLPH